MTPPTSTQSLAHCLPGSVSHSLLQLLSLFLRLQCCPSAPIGRSQRGEIRAEKQVAGFERRYPPHKCLINCTQVIIIIIIIVVIIIIICIIIICFTAASGNIVCCCCLCNHKVGQSVCVWHLLRPQKEAGNQ